MGVMSALVTAFLLGLGITVTKGTTMLKFMKEFQVIINKLIENIIIPLLPFHIAGIFSEVAYLGEIISTLRVFGSIFTLLVGMHIIYIIIQYFTAGFLAKVNPFQAIKGMMAAYLTAIGTESSAATIPFSLKSIKKLDVTEEVAEFIAPLGASIYLPGSTISIVVCAVSVLALDGTFVTMTQMTPFVMMLGITMIAAPGVPGGAVMAALGLLESMLGLTDSQIGLMMALYIAQASFGAAANVMGDGATALIDNKLSNKFI